MTEIRGFMTIACMGDYREVAAELVHDLLAARLYERSTSIELAVLGDRAGQNAIDELIHPLDKLQIRYRSAAVDEYEFPGLGLLQDACRDWDGYAYYLHTKGVSRGRANQHARYWRRLMTDHIVWDHEACIAALDHHDAVGTNWRGNHYSGNFWWARSDHIRRLPDIRALRHAPRKITPDPVWNVRLQCEFWVGMARGRFANHGVRNLDLYQTIRWTANAASIVNDLLAAGGGDRYLEIVVDRPSPYQRFVTAGSTDVISLGAAPTDIAPRLVEAATRGPYDVVFVDCWHEADLVLAVIEASLAILAPGGAIVVHDTNPPTEWHQRPASEFVEGSEWTGDTWKAVVDFRRAHPDIDVVTADTDWGCTVIRPGVPARQPSPHAPDELTWADFETARSDLLQLVSPQAFRRDLAATPFRREVRPLASRTELINCLIAEFSLERYLEIGVGEGENFQRVIAPIRQGVDPAGGATFTMTSDAFFAGQLGCETYDLVFIDGFHDEAQCLRDIEHALARVAPGGFVVVHDANPPTEWHQRPASDVSPGEEWNGTVWKAIVRFRAAHPEACVATVDLDWGCTVIRAGAAHGHADHPTEATARIDWPTFATDRARLLNLIPPNWPTVAAAVTIP